MTFYLVDPADRPKALRALRKISEGAIRTVPMPRNGDGTILVIECTDLVAQERAELALFAVDPLITQHRPDATEV